MPPAPEPPTPQPIAEPIAEPPRPREVSAAPPPPPVVAQEVVPTPTPTPTPTPPVPILARPSVPTPTVNPDVAAEIERRWYLALLERLRAMKRYPMVARRLGQEGVVLVEARIGRDGRLEGAEIKHGSGYPLLDKDALRLLEAAAETARDRLQPERPTRLEIPIAYRLEG
jgi:protein TonB